MYWYILLSLSHIQSLSLRVCSVPPKTPSGRQPKQGDCVIKSGPAQTQKNVYCQVWFGEHSSDKVETEKSNTCCELLVKEIYRKKKEKKKIDRNKKKN